MDKFIEKLAWRVSALNEQQEDILLADLQRAVRWLQRRRKQRHRRAPQPRAMWN